MNFAFHSFPHAESKAVKDIFQEKKADALTAPAFVLYKCLIFPLTIPDLEEVGDHLIDGQRQTPSESGDQF